MREVKEEVIIREYDSVEELSAEDRNLVELSKKTSKNAYAIYSKFHVGAAVLLENGEIVLGNNQENAAFPSGTCAERTAIFWAGANYPGVAVKTIAITAFSTEVNVNKPVPPCGGCRQALLEYENRYGKPMKVIMSGESGVIKVVDSMASLLPIKFGEKDMKA